MADKIRVDIVSDVVCPWCYIGYKNLEKALEIAGVEGEIVWHPYELNADMPDEGADVAEHLFRKAGITREQLEANRGHLYGMADSVGINMRGRSQRMWNTFKSHQLLTWAHEKGRQTELQLKLFEAYFEKGLEISADAVLLDLVEAAGLPRDEAEQVLADGRYQQSVRQEEAQWREMGISSVPSIILAGKGLVTGAQDPERLAQAIRKMAALTEDAPSA